MHEVFLSDEICEYISHEDFLRLVSEPGISENDIDFKVITKPDFSSFCLDF